MEAVTIVSAITAAATAAYSAKSNHDQQKQVKSARKAAQKAYDLKVAQTNLILDEHQRRNRNLLAQQQSSYKARLGADGMSPKDGSGQATLDAMQRTHDIEDKYLVEQANISLEALLNSLNETNARSLLQEAILDNQAKQSTINGLNSAGRSLLK